MNKNYFYIGLLAVGSVFTAFQTDLNFEQVSLKNDFHKKNAGGQTGLTGAPGESNCTACHTGTVQDGSSEMVITLLDGITPVTSYVPGQTYTLSLFMNSSPSKTGFSAVALDGTNANAGSFQGEALGGTQDFTSATRHYVSHTAASNDGSANPWLWTWVAPATDVGSVVVYASSNVANGNNTTTGDVIYLAQRSFTSTIGLNEEENLTTNFMAGFNAEKNQVTVNFNLNVVDDMTINLVDLSGRSVYNENLNKSELGENHEVITLPQEIKDGIYVVHFLVGNKAMSSKINIVR